MLSVTCGAQRERPDIPIGCRADVVESPLRWGACEVKRQPNGMSTAGASDRRERLAEAHLGDLGGIGLVPAVKACPDPSGSGSGPSLGDAPQPGLLRQVRKEIEECRENVHAGEKLKAHGRIGRPDSATSANVTDSVADQDPEVE